MATREHNIAAVYILSAGRSGSTLLNLLLGSHPEAIAVGELTHLPKNLSLNNHCSCGSPVRECGFWREVYQTFGIADDPYAMELGFIGATKVVDKKKMTRKYRLEWKFRHSVMSARWRFGLPIRSRRFQRSIDTTLWLYEAIREVSGAHLIVDASKSYMKGIGLYRRSPWNTRMILLTRDGRASFFSHLKGESKLERALQAWNHYYRHALPLIAKGVRGDHLLRVRYEDLATNPEAELRRICAFVGLPFDATMLDFRSTVHHVVNGNRMRHGKERRIQLDRAWETELAPAHRAYFERHAGEVNRKLGYA